MKLKQITAIVLTFIIVFGSLFIVKRGDAYVTVETNAEDISTTSPVSYPENERYIEGTVGQKLQWVIDKQEKTLTITNEGKMVSFASDTPPWTEYSSFFNNVIITSGCTSIGASAFSNCSGINSIIIPDSITSIENAAFSRCAGLTSIIIPGNVTSIGGSAFYWCTGLTSIIIPDSVTSIGSNAFSGCTALSSVSIGNGVINIDWNAFERCTGLISITIPDSVTVIRGYAFYNCTELKTVVIGNGIKNINSYAFKNCNNLEFLTVYSNNCSFDSDSISIYTTLCGFSGSTAEQYASEYGYSFFAIDNGHEHIYDNLCDEYCNYCGSKREVPPHTFGEEVVISEPDCTWDGVSNKICTECGKKLIIIYPALGHSLGEEETIKEATCTEYGQTGQRCLRCEKVFNIEYIPLKEHEYKDDYTIIKRPTCTETGIEIKECISCGQSIDIDIPKTDHIDEDNDDLCDVCHKVFSDVFIAGGMLSEGISWKLSRVGELVVQGVGAIIINTDTTTSRRIIETRYTTKSSTTRNQTQPYSSGVYSTYSETSQKQPYSYWEREGSTTSVTRPANDRDTTTSTRAPETTSANGLSQLESLVSKLDETTNPPYTSHSETTTALAYNKDLKYYRSFVKKITVKDGITEIGYNLFSGFYNVTEIDIADSVTALENYAFSNCKSLETVIIPAGVTTIGNNCFYGCDGIKNLTINNNVKCLGERAFANLKSLENLEINANDIIIQNQYYADVFANAGKESEGINLVFGDSVKDVPAFFFAVGSEMSYPNIKSITFPAGLERIGESAFEHCGSITSVSLPQSVKYIGRNAFAGCNQIAEINIHRGVEYIGEGAFSSCLGLSTVNYNAADANVENAFTNCRNIREINIGNKVQRIPAYCFSGCTNLKYARIPDTVIDIDPLAFYNCGDVAIVCDDGSYANAFASVNGLRYILNNASGTAFEIKNSTLISYDGTAKNIVLPSEIKAVNYDAFKGNSKVELIELPYSVNKIYSGAFSDCSGLKKVIIPFTVTSIADNAFEGTSAKIYCYYGSYAYDYAVKNSIPYELITAVFADESVTLYNSGTYAVEAEPSITLACGLPMVLSSDNPGVASIDSQGKVTARAPGTASIKACTQSGNLLGEMTVKVSAVSPEIHIRNYKKSIDVSLRTTVILHAQGAIPEDCRIRWFSADGVYLGEGDTYKVTEAENTFSVYVAIVDGSGKTIAASPVETVNVKSGFFQKLIAFFRKLLRRLPTVDQ